jgi:predicted phosphohydrolase
MNATGDSCKLKAAIVGDVHGQWSKDDVTALQFLDVDVVLFVGDFGEEDLALVSKIADVPLPKAVILGNHDAWSWRWQRRSKGGPPPSDMAQKQLAVLKEAHVGYSSFSVPGKAATIVGSRPFSWVSCCCLQGPLPAASHSHSSPPLARQRRGVQA